VLLIARAKWLLSSHPFIGSDIPRKPRVGKKGAKKFREFLSSAKHPYQFIF
jgi:hypothetical protein